MDSVRQYVLTVVCMVIVCGVVQMLCASGTAAAHVKLISGLMVAITIMRPLIQERIFVWDDYFAPISSNGEQMILDGQAAAENALAQLITDKTQTYILNKASDLGADIAVEVFLKDEYPMEPMSVTITGTVAPYVKQQLTECIRRELGIAKENQIWTS